MKKRLNVKRNIILHRGTLLSIFIILISVTFLLTQLGDNSLLSGDWLTGASIGILPVIDDGLPSGDTIGDNYTQHNDTNEAVQRDDIFNHSSSDSITGDQPVQSAENELENEDDVVNNPSPDFGSNDNALIIQYDDFRDDGFIRTLALPVLTNLHLNTTNITSNNTNQNLTANVTISDGDGDDVKVTYNWYRNHTTIAILNTPFEQVNGTNSDNAWDYSGLLNNLSDTAAWSATSGYDGKGAYDFNGTIYSYVKKENFENFPEKAISVAFWMKSDGGTDGIISYASSTSDNDFLIFRQGNIHVYIAGSSIATGVDVDNNKWQHLVFTWQSSDGNLSVYQNGSQAYSGTFLSGGTITAGGCLMLAQEQDNVCGGLSGGQAMPGTIDDLIIFNRSISDDQAYMLYSNKSTFLSSGETIDYDEWNVSATPNDGNGDGQMVMSNTLTVIQNIAPTIDALILNTTDITKNTTDENITAYATVSDNEGEETKTIYNWYHHAKSILAANIPFEGIAGTTTNNARDYTEFGNDGVVTGASWGATSGHDGKGAYTFDGSSNYFINLSPGTNIDFTNESFSIFAWVNPSVDDAGMIYDNRYEISSVDSGWMFGLDGSGQLAFDINGDNDNTVEHSMNNLYEAGRWHHVGAVKKGVEVKYYVNGTYYDNDSVGTSDTVRYEATENHHFIGKVEARYANSYGIPKRYFTGVIDDVQIYNTSLTDAQILRLYQNRTDIIVSNETILGDNWSVQGIANDGTSDGTAVMSNNVTIIEESEGGGCEATGSCDSTCGGTGYSDDGGTTCYSDSGCSNQCGDATTCGHIGSDVTLTADVSAANTCFTINAKEITLNCDGYTITYGTGGTNNVYGVDVSTFNGTKLLNCNVTESNAGGSDRFGILWANASHGVVNNSNISTQRATSHAINISAYGQVATNSSFDVNILNATGSSAHAFSISGTNVSNNTIRRNVLESVTASGLFIDRGIGNFIDNNSINGTVGVQFAEHVDGLAARNNTLLNTNFTYGDGDDYLIQDDTGENASNFMIYNNSFGDIRWLMNGSGNFSSNLTLNMSNSHGFANGFNLLIGSNLAALNTSAFNVGRGAINSTVNVTLLGLNQTAISSIMKLDNYTTSVAQAHVNGTNCSGISCTLIAYSGGKLEFNTTTFSSFSANEIPTAPGVAVQPLNGTSTTNRTPEFVWNNSVDTDGDLISYNLIVDDSKTFANPEINVTSIAETGTDNTSYILNTELDVDTTFFWKVRANDSDGYGADSAQGNFTIDSLISFTMLTDTVAFGTINPGDNVNTTTASPPPFKAENSGNVVVNVTVTGDAFFNSTLFPSESYQFYVALNESNAFNDTNSSTSAVDMNTTSNLPHVYDLTWQNTKDDFLTHIITRAAANETPTSKESTVTFTVVGVG